jgi:glycosyltransferase involved in cell wall biosynthesis
MKVAIVTPAIQEPNRLFGAERHFAGMVNAFQQRVDTDWVQVPIREDTWEGVLQGHLDCYDLDLSSYDLVVSTKSPTYMAQHRNHVCWLLHQMRVFYDRFDDEYGKLPQYALTEKRQQQTTIHQLDNAALQRVRKIFTNGQETARRLKLYNGFTAEVLHPPVFAGGHYCGAQEYFLLPGRLHRWKRVDLALRAMQHISGDVPLLIPGTGEDEPHFRELAAGDKRIHFLGFLSDAEMRALYADALAVLFVPKDEDFGYITIEAMLSHKPLIVCTDSGEPARLVQNGRSGFVVNPDPVEIAAAMGLLAADRELARTLGEFAFQNAPSQDWDRVVERILKAGAFSCSGAGTDASSGPKNPVSILVADNQVLDPPIGGGRIRIYELYRHLAALGFEVSYVGAYDWPGPAYREQFLAPHFRECVTPLTQPHFAHNRRYERATGGKTTIDVTIPKLLQHSPRFRRMAQEHGQDARIVIIAHPWVYPHVPRRPDQKLIYDAQNCEYVVKQQILGDTAAGRELVQEVHDVEEALCRNADLIFVCSQEDAGQFSSLYGVPAGKCVLVPNGVDVENIQPATEPEKERARQDLGLPQGKPILIFIGSGYGPNTEAAMFLVKELAPKLPGCTIVIAGSVKDSYAASKGPPAPQNVVWTGVVDSDQRRSLYQAADIALNPMFSGSGTNLKMLDYFAAALPVVSTSAGARGLTLKPQDCVICAADQFAAEINTLIPSSEARSQLGENARKLAVENYAWPHIATHAAEALLGLLEKDLAAAVLNDAR